MKRPASSIGSPCSHLQREVCTYALYLKQAIYCFFLTFKKKCKYHASVPTENLNIHTLAFEQLNFNV